MNAQILAQVNTLMVRRGIALHRIERILLSGVNRAEVKALETFARAAQSRARHLLAQLG